MFGLALAVPASADPTPTIRLSPPGGPPGTIVTVHNLTAEPFSRDGFSSFYFGDATAHFDNVPSAPATWLDIEHLRFTVPANAGCGDHYFFFTNPGQELPWPFVSEDPVDPPPPPPIGIFVEKFEVTGPCDSTKRDSLDVLNYNIQLLPTIACARRDYGWLNFLQPICDPAKPGYGHCMATCGDAERTDLLAQHPDLRDHDVIIFEEAFADDYRKELKLALRPFYPYQTGGLGSDRAEIFPDEPLYPYLEQGGVTVLSKWPISDQEQHLYSRDHCLHTAECHSQKGVQYVRIDKAGKHYSLFGTHLAADDGATTSADRLARYFQFGELATFIFDALRWNDVPDGEPVLVSGDFNVDRNAAPDFPNSPGATEYGLMLRVLPMLTHPEPDGSNPGGTNRRGAWLDHIFTYDHGAQPTSARNIVVKPQHPASPYLYDDLSDHFAVRGKFVFNGGSGGGGGDDDPPVGGVPRAPSNAVAEPWVGQWDQIGVSWRDESDNESDFVIDRLDPVLGYWVRAGVVGANEKHFTDTVTEPDFGGMRYYRYRVSAENVYGASGYSYADTRLYTVPPERPITDAPGSCVLSLQPRLHWFNSTRATSYRVEVHEYVSGRSVYDNTHVLSQEVTLPTLTAGIAYAYRVWGQDNAGVGEASEERYFTPMCGHLAQPVLREPQGCVESVRPTLRWDPVPGAHGYVVKVRIVDLGRPIVLDADVYPPPLPYVTTPYFTLDRDLETGREYWYQVKPNDGANDGPWSGFKYFTVDCAHAQVPIGSVGPISPGGTISTSRPAFRWETTRGATAYRLLVNSRTTNLDVHDAIYAAEGNCTAATCEVTPAGLDLPAGSYYFRVYGRAGTVEGPLSPFINFIVPALPTLAPGDVSLVEGTGGQVMARVPLTLTAASSTAVTVQVTAEDGSATSPADFAGGARTATVPAGQTTGWAELPVESDGADEPSESFVVRLSRLQGARADDLEATVTIVDDDLPMLRVSSLSVAEPLGRSSSPQAWQVDLSNPSNDPISVPFTVQACTATAGTDYVAAAGGLVNFAPGQTSQPIPFTVSGDNTLEGHEIFSVQLGAPSGATLAEGYGQTTIVENNGPVLGVIRADFDGDGNNDAVFFDPLAGAYGIWRLQGLTRLGSQLFTPSAPVDANWKLAGVADFNSDAKPDLLWRHAQSGRLSVWFMDGTVRVSGVTFDGPLDTSWTLVGTGPLGAPMGPDLLWRNPANGQMYAWLMDGIHLVEERLLDPAAPADTNWVPQLLADFNGDGNADLLFRNSTSGALVVWILNGTSRSEGRSLAPAVPDFGWKVVSAFDADADGTTDLVWRHSLSGRVVVWLLSGTTRRCAGVVVPDEVATQHLSVVGPR